jgi:hypothetical protein
MTVRSYRPEVQADDTGKWYPNGLRFATREEAEARAKDLVSRWTLAFAWRATESEEEPNYSYIDGELKPILPADAVWESE